MITMMAVSKEKLMQLERCFASTGPIKAEGAKSAGLGPARDAG